MKKLLLLSFLAIGFLVNAQAPAGYYSSTQGKTGFALKTELSQIISSGHNTLSYGALWTAYQTSDVDTYYENDGSVLDIYSENPSSTDPYNFVFGSDQCGNYSGESSCYNREHLFPKSWFNDQSPMYTDIHHIYPTDGYVNGQRGNFSFGEVSNASWTSQNGSKKGNNTYNHPNAYNGTVFEPIDEFKGDVARVWFYMATRYESQIAGWENNTSQSDVALNGTSTQVFEDWVLAMLLEWHNNDPVSQKEIDRNNAAFNFQGNRNPYIDNPAWVNQIWNPNPDNQAPTAPTNLAASNITSNSVILNWTAATDNVGVTSYQIEENNQIVQTTANTQATVTNLNPQSTYSFIVKALDAYGNVSAASNAVNVTTLDAPVIIFSEDFEDCNNLNFISVSEQSAQDWECLSQYGENNSGAYQMNAYANGQQYSSLDWLITDSPIDFSNLSQAQLSFFTAATFGNTPLNLVYSTDYTPGSTPSNATWTPVPNVNIPMFSGSGSTIEENTFSNIDIQGIAGNAYLAFKYDTTNGEDATRWTVDSFTITAKATAGLSATSLQAQIYPNPNYNGVLFVELSNVKNYDYALYDLNGRLILNKQNANTRNIKLPQLEAGIYLFEIKSKQQRVIKKLILN